MALRKLPVWLPFSKARKTDMSHDPRRLLEWSVPNSRQRYTRRDTALYALSVGVGHDPLDKRQLALIDPWSEQLATLPSMALVLAYPGFWLGDSRVRQATGIAPSQILHAEQSVELHDVLPVAAEVTGQTRVTGLIDKGAGRGALVYSERLIQTRDGRPLATCRQVHYLRGVGGFGGSTFAPPSLRASPQGESDLAIDLPTRPEQALLYRLNGDSNRLHIDPEAAREAGFARPLLHGMCTAGIVLHAVLHLLAGYDIARVRGFSLRMTAPVLPGDTLRTEVWNDGSFRARVLERDLLVIDNGYADL